MRVGKMRCRQTVRRTRTVLLDKGLFLTKKTTKKNKEKKKTLRLALEHVKNCRSGLSLVALDCSAGQILIRKFSAHERQFLQGNLFLQAVHEVPLYLCSRFCSPSLVQLSTASYRIVKHK